MTTSTLDLTGYRIDPGYPYPQANSVAKVAVTVDLVAAGVDTDEALAIGLGVVDRQGAMYATACGYLGLIAETGSAPRTWGLTSAGVAFLTATPQDRVHILAALFEQVAQVEVLTSVDGQELADTTIARRLDGVTACQSALDAAGAAASVTLEQDQTRMRVPVAAAHAATQRHAARVVVRVAPVCSSCHMTIPATGVCDWC